MSADAATKEQVLEALGAIVDPSRGVDIVSAGMVTGLAVSGTAVGFSIEVEPERGPALEPLRKAAEKAVLEIPGIASATVVLTAHSNSASPSPPPQRPPARHTWRGDEPPTPGTAPGARAEAVRPHRRSLAHHRNRLRARAASEKSTVASNLCLALARLGRRVGLLDADVYGPSQPRMLGVSGRPSTPDGKTILAAPQLWRDCHVDGIHAGGGPVRGVAWSHVDVSAANRCCTRSSGDGSTT